MLAAGADALLARHGARVVAAFQPLKHALELHHPGVGEQERRIVAGNEGGAWDLVVATSLEVVDKVAADFGGLHGCKI